jgi:hypothetical protein
MIGGAIGDYVILENALNERKGLWNTAGRFLIVLSEAVLVIEKDVDSRFNGFEHEHD